MAVQAIGYNTLGPGERVDLSTTDSAVIGAGVSVISTTSYAVFGAGTGQSVAVHGLAAGTVGIGWLTGTDSRISVGQSGAVQGYSSAGIAVAAHRMQIANHGTISGATDGIYLLGAGQVVANSGVLESFGTGADQAAIRSDYGNGPTNTGPLIQNSGLLRGANAFLGSAYDERLENSGQIIGAVLMNAGSDTLINRGSINGTVNTGDGPDLIDNRGGTINGAVDVGGGYDQLDNSGGVINGHVLLTWGNVTNRGGVIQGSLTLGDSSDYIDTVDGQIYGPAYLGGGDDVFDGRGASWVSNGVYGGEGDDSLSGGSREDWLWGDSGNDTLRGSRGDDTLNGGAGTDLIYGGTDDDSVTGDTGNDTLYGGAGDDTVDGGTNNDMVSGGSGDDVLLGNTGNDTLYGGWGSDTLTGGAAADVFVFNTPANGEIDEITDFSAADDTIRLDDAAFAGLAAGALAAAAFVANTSGLATTAAHRVIYESDSGALWFDADGTGSGARVQFATLGTGLATTAADFFVY